MQSHLLAAKIAVWLIICLVVKVSSPSCVFHSQRNTQLTHKRHKCTQPHSYMALRQTRAVAQVQPSNMRCVLIHLAAAALAAAKTPVFETSDALAAGSVTGF